MSKIAGINLPMGIVPNAEHDKYPTHYAEYGHGGYRCVTTMGELSNIPLARLEAGCMCFVVETAAEYRWTGAEWKIAPRGGQADVDSLLLRVEALEGSTSVDRHKVVSYPSPAASWSCDHGLGKKPAVTIVDTAGNELLADVTHVSDDKLIVYFGKAQAGKLILN